VSDPITYQPSPDQAPAPAKKKFGARQIFGIIVLVVGLGIAGIAWAVSYISGDPITHRPEVGNCMTDGATADDLKVIDCTDAKAKLTVVGIVDGTYGDSQKSEGNPCLKWDTAETSLWIGEVDKTDKQPQANDKGKVYCLASKK